MKYMHKSVNIFTALYCIYAVNYLAHYNYSNIILTSSAKFGEETVIQVWKVALLLTGSLSNGKNLLITSWALALFYGYIFPHLPIPSPIPYNIYSYKKKNITVYNCSSLLTVFSFYFPNQISSRFQMAFFCHFCS